jgi:predicted peptidase
MLVPVSALRNMESPLKKARAVFLGGPLGSSLPYRLFFPAGYDSKKKYPFVFWLHGSGGRV